MSDLSSFVEAPRTEFEVDLITYTTMLKTNCFWEIYIIDRNAKLSLFSYFIFSHVASAVQWAICNIINRPGVEGAVLQTPS